MSSLTLPSTDSPKQAAIIVRTPYIQQSDLADAVKESCFSVNGILKSHAYRNEPLPFDLAYLLGVYTLASFDETLAEPFAVSTELAARQSLAALSSFHNRALYDRPGAEQQIAGICSAVFDYDIGRSPNGFIPLARPVMDNCGMGGDLFRTPNLSTLAALIAAADGIAMLKHGSPGNTDAVGSSDFLEGAGVHLYVSPNTVRQGIEEYAFAYTEALDPGYKRIHRQTHSYGKLAHMNDIIGPITNPADPAQLQKRVLGVNHLVSPVVVARAYNEMNARGITNLHRGIFVRGAVSDNRDGGIDEIGLFAGGTQVAELNNGSISEYKLHASDFGCATMLPEQIHPGPDKVATSLAIIRGEIVDRRRDAALANAAVLYSLAHNDSLRAGYERASETLASGRPAQTLANYAALTQKVRV